MTPEIRTAPEIHTVPSEEMVPWLKTMRTSLQADPGNISDSQLDYWREVWDPERIWGAYDGGRCVGTLRTFDTDLGVPTGPGSAAPIPTDALTQVGVAATHRRQGLLRRMLTASLTAAKERGEAVSLLRAAEWGIYGRFGYWPAAPAADYTIRTGNPSLTVRPPAQPVEVVQVDPSELLDPARSVLDRLSRQAPGQIRRPPAMWKRTLRLHNPASLREPVCVVARSASGEVDGYAMWTGQDGDWYHDPVHHVQARIDEILAVTPDAERALWNYLVHIDLVRSLTLEAYPVDLPLEWLLSDGRDARRTWSGDNDWLRILDLPATLCARRYATTDRLVLDVVDEDGGFAAGRFVLDGGPEHAECTPTNLSADLTLSQRALAGSYLGGYPVRAQQQAGLLDEETPGAARRLQAMLVTERAPWNATPF
ncbi:MAG TPA: GNAT family N-acetyltransferase [Jatrophihabitans sp.]|nr:GNAT family N-acetyltransferase [Jatrophihabitans sp.]